MPDSWGVRIDKTWFLPPEAYCPLGRQTTQCRYLGYSVVRKLTEGEQVAVGVPGVHPNLTGEVGTHVGPSPGQDTLELSLEG